MLALRGKDDLHNKQTNRQGIRRTRAGTAELSTHGRLARPGTVTIHPVGGIEFFAVSRSVAGVGSSIAAR
jgi:hypothetical protein